MGKQKLRANSFLLSALLALNICAADANAQAGRQPPTSSQATYPVDAPPQQTQTPQRDQAAREFDSLSLMTCRCLEHEGEFERVDNNAGAAPEETIYRRRELSTPAVILSKPNVRYTEQARLHSTSGVVRLRVVLAATGKVTRVEVIKGLPDGLTENAISVACRIKFKPATKDDRPVSQAVMVEYAFKVYDSLIQLLRRRPF